MILSEKIIKLRKQLGWSQEDLAEKMDVSRQSVSKWESTNSIPDLNKIIKLADLFGVSTDFLLKDNMDTTEFIHHDTDNERPQISLEQALHYVETKFNEAKSTLKAVVLLVCSPALLFLLMAFSEGGWVSLSGQTVGALGVISILFVVSVAVAMLIKANKHARTLFTFEKAPFNLAYGVHSALTEKLDTYTPIYNNRLAISVVLFIASPIPLLLAAILNGRSDLVLIMLVVLLGFVAVGIANLLPASAKFEAYKHMLDEGNQLSLKSQSAKHGEQIGAILWPLVIAIYLGWSFWTGYWYITWIVFPVASMVFVALIGVMNLVKANKAN